MFEVQRVITFLLNAGHPTKKIYYKSFWPGDKFVVSGDSQDRYEFTFLTGEVAELENLCTNGDIFDYIRKISFKDGT